MNSRLPANLQSTVALLSGLSLLIAATATIISIPEPVEAVSFQEPNRKPPRGTLGGGSRSGSTVIASLLPRNGYGVTNLARPTFVVYLAPGAVSGRTATFYLRDTETAEQYEATIPLMGESGIVAFQLPETFQDLAIERPYQWFLALKATGEGRPRAATTFVRGTIERLPASPEAANELMLSLDAAISASQEGRWYDAVATLAALRQARPESLEISTHWKEFLQSVELDDFVDAPTTQLLAQPQ
ncbi:MAG: DUF928 domain-containing protein [Cyanobacteria bacterium J06641_5]